MNQAYSSRAASVMKAAASKTKAPLFLRKTYTMVEICDPNVASWSDNGRTFVVKDPERFAAEMIPEFFKHNNFSSFVRQLNFYGFRKIRNDPLRLKDSNDEQNKHCKFCHEHFQRNRLDLLSKIKKSATTENAEKAEVEVLREEVNELRKRLASMTDEMQVLESTVMNYAGGSSHLKDDRMYEPEMYPSLSKKPKLDPSPYPVSLQSDMPYPSTTLSNNYNDSFVVFKDLEPLEFEPGTFFGESSDEKFLPSTVLGSEMSSDDYPMQVNDFNTDDFTDLDPLNTNIDQIVESSIRCLDQDNSPIVRKLELALSAIPREQQEQLVDRLVETLTDPQAYKQNMNAALSLSTIASQEAQKSLRAAGMNPNDPQLKNLIAPILGSYMLNAGNQDLHAVSS